MLYERGDQEPLRRHADFRLFGAMNPANDVGKRNLAPNVRARFTELFVDELSDEHDLAMLVKAYLAELGDVNNELVKSIVDFYFTVRSQRNTDDINNNNSSSTSGQHELKKKLVNGIGMPPTYSLRTLCRALRNAAQNQFNNTRFSVCDSLCLSFLTDLNRESSAYLEEYIKKCILKNASAQSRRPAARLHADTNTFVCVEDYAILRGPLPLSDDNKPPQPSKTASSVARGEFIFTESARANLKVSQFFILKLILN